MASSSVSKNREQVPVVAIQNGQAVTTSLDVARYFRKRHKNVLQAIQKLIPQLPDHHKNWLNFQPLATNRQDYINSGSNAITEYYQLTRDGFVLLAMGFTGPKAMQFKVAYIAAFNAMESKLREDQLWVGGLSQALERICPAPPKDSLSVSSLRAVKTLRALTAYWAMLEGMPQPVAEKAVCAVGRIQQLDDFSFEKDQGEYVAMEDFVERLIANSSAKDNEPASDQQIQTIKYLVDACAQLRYSRNRNIYEMLLADYGISVETILTASSSQAMRIANVAYQLLHGHQVLTDVINQIKCRAKKADEQRKKLPNVESNQTGGKP